MKKIIGFNLIILILCSFFFFFDKDSRAQSINAPIFYGATKIEIDKNVLESSTFDILDPRFRIFARDYEDGDLTPNIVCTYNDVTPSTPGSYNIKYSVCDNDGNEVSIDVEVIINDSNDGNVAVRRTTYAIPAMKNMSSIGMERCNTGDRQMLGIYVKSGGSFTLRALDNIVKRTEVTFFTDTRKENSYSYINASSFDEVVMSNLNSGVSYNSIPFLTSIRLDSEDVNTLYNYELSYNISDCLPLDYFHYKDDEESFYLSWKESQNDFALVDCETMQMVVPYGDINNLGKTFLSLDDVCNYYIEVVNKMDKMVGLSFNPINEYDRNYRTKYIAVCDKDYGGAGAYYMGSYIAVCNSSIYGLFTYGWGTLHEIGHGYQGNFGKGNGAGSSLYFNETGNNVFAYYIQTDKSLYKDSSLWLGEMSKIEDGLNEKRKNGVNVFNNNDGTYTNVREKLYFILTLMNSFEGSESYAKLNSYYRKIVSEYGTNKYSVIDIYAMFFKDCYNADILQYLNAWHLSLSNEVLKDILDSNLTSYFIKEDYDSSLINDGELKYTLINENDIVNKKKGFLTINLDSTICLNKVIGVFKDGSLINQIKVNSNKITLNNLEYGNYKLVFPTIYGYNSKEVVLLSLINESQCMDYIYTKNEYDYDPSMKLWIRGIYQTVGLTLTLTNHNQKGVINLGGANLGNQTAYWKNNPDLTFLSITILDNDENTVKEYIVKGNKYFTEIGEGAELDLEYGYKIKIYTQKPGYVNMWYGEYQLRDFNVDDNNIEYQITKEGFKLLNKELDTYDYLYNIDKVSWINAINDYKNSVTIEEINNKNTNSEYKELIISYYNYLNDTDKDEFSDFINKIKLGGTPNISVINQNTTIIRNSNIDLTSYISVYDNEDYYIKDYEIISSIDTSNVGEYSVIYNVYDSDNNCATKTIVFMVIYSDAEIIQMAKDEKIELINNLSQKYSIYNYSDAGTTKINDLISSVKDEVNNLSNVDDINAYDLTALNIKLLEVAKAEKIKQIDNIALKYSTYNYSDAETIKINDLISSVKDEVNNLSNVDDINNYDLNNLDTQLSLINTNDTNIDDNKKSSNVSWNLFFMILAVVFGSLAILIIFIIIIKRLKRKKVKY